jgi:hypothetical protein
MNLSLVATSAQVRATKEDRIDDEFNDKTYGNIAAWRRPAVDCRARER